jgi:hypothetical protein
MSDPDEFEAELLLAALRADLPSERTRERMRVRLTAAGVLTAGALSSVSAAAASGSGARASLGLFQKLGTWSLASKLGVVVAVGSLPVAAIMVAQHAPTQHAVSVEPTARTRHVAASTDARPELAQLALAHDASRSEQSAASRVGMPAATTLDGTLRSSGPPLRPGSALTKRHAVAALTRAVDAAAERSSLGARGQSASDTTESAAPGTGSSAARGDASTANTQLPAATRASAREPAPPSAADQEAASTIPQPTAAMTEFHVPLAPSAPRLPVRRAHPTELAQETKLMERALAALRVGDLPAARAWLNLHALHFHDGLLKTDRERVFDRIGKLRARNHSERREP